MIRFLRKKVSVDEIPVEVLSVWKPTHQTTHIMKVNLFILLFGFYSEILSVLLWWDFDSDCRLENVP